jgi:hypothetical protein
MRDFVTLSDEEKRALSNASLTSRGINVAAASVVLLNPNPNRKLCTICNDSANIVYLSLGQVAITAEGIRLNPNGGVFTLGEFSDFPYFGSVSAISVAAGSNVVITEV